MTTEQLLETKRQTLEAMQQSALALAAEAWVRYRVAAFQVEVIQGELEQCQLSREVSET